MRQIAPWLALWPGHSLLIVYLPYLFFSVFPACFARVRFWDHLVLEFIFLYLNLWVLISRHNLYYCMFQNTLGCCLSSLIGLRQLMYCRSCVFSQVMDGRRAEMVHGKQFLWFSLDFWLPFCTFILWGL